MAQISQTKLVFENSHFCVRIWATDKRTNRWTALSRKGALTVASGALIVGL